MTRVLSIAKVGQSGFYERLSIRLLPLRLGGRAIELGKFPLAGVSSTHPFSRTRQKRTVLREATDDFCHPPEREIR